MADKPHPVGHLLRVGDLGAGALLEDLDEPGRHIELIGRPVKPSTAAGHAAAANLFQQTPSELGKPVPKALVLLIHA